MHEPGRPPAASQTPGHDSRSLFPALVLGALDRGGGAGTRNLNARCRRFESGEWEALLAEHHEREDELAEEREEREGGPRGDGEPSDAVAQEHRIRRCLRLGRAGELSRAARAFTIRSNLAIF
jgi:hypothetical protein